MSQKPQYRYYLITLIAITIFSLLGLIHVLLVGQNIGLIDLKQRSDASSTIEVLISPIGSEVILDKKSVGVTPLNLSVNAGKHLIHVEYPNHYPYEIEITTLANETIRIERRLLFMQYVKNIANDGYFPQWQKNDAIIYLSRSDDVIYRYYLTGEQEELIEAPYYLTGMVYAGDSIFLRGIFGEFPELDIISLSDGSLNALGIGYPLPVWKNNEEGYFFLAWSVSDLNLSPNDFHLWNGKDNAPPQPLSLPEITKAISSESIGWSADGQWFLSQSVDHVNIWKFDSKSFTFAQQINPSYGASWAPIGSQLAYLQSNGSVYYIKNIAQNPSPEFLIGNGTLPLRWMPDGKQIVFTTYNPSEGGSAFWAVDVNNRSRTLLADSSLILGRVTDFAISPDGTRIAFTNDLNQLNILFIGEQP